MGTTIDSYDYLEIYKKCWFFGTIWILKEVVRAYIGQEKKELYYRTRDHYKQLYGYGNLRIDMCWTKSTRIF